MNGEKIYINLGKKFSVDVNSDVFVKDVGEVYCNNNNLKKEVENIVVYEKKSEENWDYITNIDVIKKILKSNPNLDVEVFGSLEILIEIKSKETTNQFFEILKIGFVCLILFFGAGIAIINFHEDVNMIESLEKIYYTFTGKKSAKPLIISIPYSIGLGVGALVFFNRMISKSKRRKKEPGPMEIELYSYDQELEDVILNDLRKDK